VSPIPTPFAVPSDTLTLSGRGSLAVWRFDVEQPTATLASTAAAGINSRIAARV
jgi:hypothetical protein